MRYPEFFDKAPSFSLYDPLAEFLGATENGEIEIKYIDCVKLAGHSCPTVAGAYILTYQALKALYQDELPRRSEITISLREPKDSGVTGVIGTVCSFICGASDEGGFAGIGSKFSRRDKLHYGVSSIEGDIEFKREDNSKSISLKLDTSAVPGNPNMMPLMQKALGGMASEEEKREFQAMWQKRVEYMITNPQHWDNIAKIIKES